MAHVALLITPIESCKFDFVSLTSDGSGTDSLQETMQNNSKKTQSHPSYTNDKELCWSQPMVIIPSFLQKHQWNTTNNSHSNFGNTNLVDCYGSHPQDQDNKELESQTSSNATPVPLQLQLNNESKDTLCHNKRFEPILSNNCPLAHSLQNYKTKIMRKLFSNLNNFLTFGNL